MWFKFQPLLFLTTLFLPSSTAKRLLTEIVEKGRPTPFHHNDGPGMTVQEILVPASKAGLVIGKGGETIKQLQVRLPTQWEHWLLVSCRLFVFL